MANAVGTAYSVNSEMLMGKLRGEFGFEGIVATDCGALNDAREPLCSLSLPVCMRVVLRENAMLKHIPWVGLLSEDASIASMFARFG